MSVRTRPLRRMLASLPALLLIAVFLILIVWLRRHQPSYVERLAPIQVNGASGQRFQARNFAAEVDVTGLQVGKALRATSTRSFKDETVMLTTPGIWLSLPARVEALHKTGVVSAMLRSRDGLIYVTGDNNRPKAPALNLADRFVAPGLPEHGRYFFELPADRLEGAHVQLYWGSSTPGHNDTLLDIDLDIDAERARELLRNAATLEAREGRP